MPYYTMTGREERFPLPEKRADPTPLGLTGFASIVLMVSLHYAEVVENTDWMVPLAFLAGACLLFASYVHFSLGNTHPATNFGVYGAFWMGNFAYMWLERAHYVDFMRLLRIPVAIYTVFAWVVSLHISRASFFTFTMLEIKLLCFIIGELIGSRNVLIAGGWFGVACAIGGYYTAASHLLRPYVILPVGQPFRRAPARAERDGLEQSKLQPAAVVGVCGNCPCCTGWTLGAQGPRAANGGSYGEASPAASPLFWAAGGGTTRRGREASRRAANGGGSAADGAPTRGALLFASGGSARAAAELAAEAGASWAGGQEVPGWAVAAGGGGLAQHHHLMAPAPAGAGGGSSPAASSPAAPLGHHHPQYGDASADSRRV